MIRLLSPCAPFRTVMEHVEPILLPHIFGAQVYINLKIITKNICAEKILFTTVIGGTPILFYEIGICHTRFLVKE